MAVQVRFAVRMKLATMKRIHVSRIHVFRVRVGKPVMMMMIVAQIFVQMGAVRTFVDPMMIVSIKKGNAVLKDFAEVIRAMLAPVNLSVIQDSYVPTVPV